MKTTFKATTLAWASLASSLAPSMAHTDPAYNLLYVPKIPGYSRLQIQNLESSPLPIWIQGPVTLESAVSESGVEIRPSQSQFLEIKDLPSGNWVELRSPERREFSVYLVSDSQQTLGPIAEDRSDSAQTYLSVAAPDQQVVVLNLSPLEQEGSILFAHQQQVNFHLPPFGSWQMPVPDSLLGSVLLRGEYALTGYIASSNTALAPVLFSPKNSHQLWTAQKGAYFLVSSVDRALSYVIRIEKPDQIAAAREQLHRPDDFLPRILIGEVRLGHDQTNRDPLSLHKTPWSWNLNLIRFAEFASQSCDGNPQMLENLLLLWHDSQMATCFWNYRIIQELDPTKELAP